MPCYQTFIILAASINIIHFIVIIVKLIIKLFLKKKTAPKPFDNITQVSRNTGTGMTQKENKERLMKLVKDINGWTTEKPKVKGVVFHNLNIPNAQ